jgi:hypothetical protein
MPTAPLGNAQTYRSFQNHWGNAQVFRYGGINKGNAQHFRYGGILKGNAQRTANLVAGGSAPPPGGIWPTFGNAQTYRTAYPPIGGAQTFSFRGTLKGNAQSYRGAVGATVGEWPPFGNAQTYNSFTASGPAPWANLVFTVG